MIPYFIILGVTISMVSWVLLMRDLHRNKENMSIAILGYLGTGLFFGGLFYDMSNTISLNDLIGSYVQFPDYLSTIFLSIGIFLLFISFVCIYKRKYIDNIAVPTSYIGLFLFITSFFIK